MKLNHHLLGSQIEMAIRKLRYHKAAGLDDIVAEMIKATAEKEVDFCFKIWTTGISPNEWCASIYILIPSSLEG
ncbi:Hypothetical protein CINCED_3A016939 [Cinara cedri]|uniref:Reverse transcriptase domain n=1 Tax=Cinara cedri TaxID=506608 RepID=A0A5E4MPW2_9HEMI|nr:Hypothetical protein CINCED_3A016939 [Cinara cedri]